MKRPTASPFRFVHPSCPRLDPLPPPFPHHSTPRRFVAQSIAFPFPFGHAFPHRSTRRLLVARACVRALPPSHRIAAANNVATYVYPSSSVSLDAPATRGAQPPVYIPVLYARQLLRRDTRIGRTDDESKAQADRPFPARLIRSKRFSNRRPRAM